MMCFVQFSAPRLTEPATISAAQDTEKPIAVIAPIDTTVSNGTLVTLDGSGSWDDVYVWSYTWNVTVNGISEFYYGKTESLFFRNIGLYFVTLTVRDQAGNSNMSWTAFMTVIDLDQDALPDWWEDSFWHNLTRQSTSGDPDRDGWTNLEEYNRGTNPTVADPSPPGFIDENWMYLVLLAAVIVVSLAIFIPRYRKKMRVSVKKKIAFAIEIEKALEEEKK
jgi:hypothetical protein